MATKKAKQATPKKATTKKSPKKATAGKKQAAPKKKATAKKSKTKKSPVSVGRFAGEKLFFAGRPESYTNSIKEFKDWASEEGAVVQKKLTAETDILIE